MQPCTTFPHPTGLTAQPTAAPPLVLRQAQRAFAALVEAPLRRAATDAFRRAQLAGTARRTLSALSADEFAALTNWLALQFASRDGSGAAGVQALLGRVDAALAAAVGAALGEAHRRLLPDTHATVA